MYPRTFVLALALALAVAAPLFAKIDPPVPVRMVSPDYPDELRREGVMGVVVIKFTVDTHGDVVDPEIEKSTNDKFDKPAMDAVKKWKFKPAQQDGSPIAKKVSVPIRFVADN